MLWKEHGFNVFFFTKYAFHGCFGAPRHMILEHEEGEIGIALVGALDGDVFV
jgi:hypothetical protein